MTVAVAAALTCLKMWGLIEPHDERTRFDEDFLPYSEAVAAIDKAWLQHGEGEIFLREATEIVDASTAFFWINGAAPIHPRDNWILSAAVVLDPVVHALGLKNDRYLFTSFESFRYQRALRRGFGICSQLALGLAGLLYEKYGVHAHMAGLGGHVVVEARLPNGERRILDPSAGVLLPFGVDAAAAQMPLVRSAYARRGFTSDSLPATYDATGNVIADAPGARGYAPDPWKQHLLARFKVVSDILKWAIPITLPIAAGVLLRRRSTVEVNAIS